MNNPLITLHIHSDGEEVHQLDINPTPYIPRIGEKIRLKIHDIPKPFYKKKGIVTQVSYALDDADLLEVHIAVEVLM